MKHESIKKKLLLECRKLGISMVGFAPVERWENPPKELPNTFAEWIPEEFWPQSIYPEVKTVVVIGFPVQLPIVETAPSIYYHELYKTVNALLDGKAYEISNFLTENGYPSIYLPRDGYGDIDVLLEKPIAFFSHKHAAYLAEMGSFGQNNVLLTPQYGPRVRFTSIFTTAEIEPDHLKTKDLCTRCMSCAESCPVKAIPLTENKDEFPQQMDKITCARRSKKLKNKYIFPCGICIKVCPVGNDRKVFKRENINIYLEDKDSNEDKDFNKYKKACKHVKKYGSKQ
jgi:epoxyqueuosine reductase